MGGVEGPGLVDFGEVVIFGREPEDGDGADAALRERPGEFDGGERFEDRIERSAEEADLLAGDDGDGVGLGEFVDRWVIRIRLAKSGDEGGAAVSGVDDLLGGLGVGFGIVGVVRVKALNAVESIKQVGEEARGSREFGVAYTVLFHPILLERGSV